MSTLVRSVKRVIKSVPTSDGQGVRLSRTIGMPPVANLDPFLLLDEFKSDDVCKFNIRYQLLLTQNKPNDYIAGFPDHPHRGFETVTYMLEGSMEHKDNKGNSGLLTSGSVQWMTAGRGIIHSEMPKQENGVMWGFQLWVNLPAKMKMVSPRYQDIPPEDIPEKTLDDGIHIRVICGEFDGTLGPIKDIVTNPFYFDVTVPKGKRFRHAVEIGHTVFAYPFVGQGNFSGKSVSRGSLVIFEDDGQYVEVATDTEDVRFILVGGKPIGEPIARRGPFVMNTQEEIAQTFKDFYNGNF